MLQNNQGAEVRKKERKGYKKEATVVVRILTTTTFEQSFCIPVFIFSFERKTFAKRIIKHHHHHHQTFRASIFNCKLYVVVFYLALEHNILCINGYAITSNNQPYTQQTQ